MNTDVVPVNKMGLAYDQNSGLAHDFNTQIFQSVYAREGPHVRYDEGPHYLDQILYGEMRKKKLPEAEMDPIAMVCLHG